MAAFLVSCEKPENNNAQEPEYEISIRPAELLFEAEGGEQTVTVTSKYGEEDAAWQISMDADGVFTCSALNSAYITIYNNHPDDMYKCVSVLMHELGHFVHYGERGGYRMFTKVHDLITESFASYVGWLLGNKFYTDKGYTGNLNVIGNQSRQTWHKGMTGTISHYSPLFVDLVDDFNQGSLNSKYPTDRIENVPNSLISIIAEEDYDWNELKSRLQNYVGTYYTEQDLTTYLSNYEYWFSNN